MTAPALIVDTLALTPSVQPYFIVNSTQNEVAIFDHGSDSVFSKNGAAAAFYFDPADNLLLLELGIILPYCFGMGDIAFLCTLSWEKSDGSGALSISQFMIPYANQPFSLAGSKSDGLYIPHYSLSKPAAGIKARLKVVVANGWVSMVNVPSNFPDLTQLGVNMYLKIQHQLPMSA